MAGEDLPHIPGYRLVARLGMGASGVTYRAERLSDGQDLALKVLHAHLGDEPALRRRFLRECRLVQRLEHPHIVRMLEVFEWNDVPVLALEFVQGTTLSAWIPDPQPGGPEVPPLEQRIAAVARVAEALSYAHGAGVVHRDVKPGNILVRPDGQPVLIDFGLARHQELDSTITRTGEVGGSPAYMSPEHYHDMKDVDARSDIWSLGVTLFELVAGRRPFEGDTRLSLMRSVVRDEPPRLERLVADAPTGLEPALLRALEKHPGHRYQDAQELARALEKVARGAGVPGRGASSRVRRELRRVRRGRMTIALGAIAVLAAILLYAREELEVRALENAVAEGRAQLEYGDLDAALAAFERATEARPDDLRGPRWRATALLLFDRWRAAQDALASVGGLGVGDGPDADAHDADVRVADVHEGADLGARSGVEHLHLGVAAVLARDWVCAEAHLSAAVAADPTLYEAYQPLVQVQRQAGADDEMLRRTLGQAQQGLRPANPRSQINAAQILELGGDFAGALEVLDELEASDEFARSPHRGIHRHRGRIHLGLGLALRDLTPPQHEAARAAARRAVASLELALEHNPQDVQARSNLGKALVVLERYEDAERSARELLALVPDERGGLQVLITAQVAQGRWDQARAEAVRFGPGEREQVLVRIDFNEGLALRRKGVLRVDDAEALFRRCVDADPAFAAGWFELGLCHNDSGRYDEAYTLFERAGRVLTEGPSPLDTQWTVALASATPLRVALGLFLSGCGTEDEGRALASREGVRALLEPGQALATHDLADLMIGLSACEVPSVRDCDWAEELHASAAYREADLSPDQRALVDRCVADCRR